METIVGIPNCNRIYPGTISITGQNTYLFPIPYNHLPFIHGIMIGMNGMKTQFFMRAQGALVSGSHFREQEIVLVSVTGTMLFIQLLHQS